MFIHGEASAEQTQLSSFMLYERRKLVGTMFSRKDHRLPPWLPSAHFGKGDGYSEIAGTSASDRLEMNDLDA